MSHSSEFWEVFWKWYLKQVDKDDENYYEIGSETIGFDEYPKIKFKEFEEWWKNRGGL